jgi:hypothetical protein
MRHIGFRQYFARRTHRKDHFGTLSALPEESAKSALPGQMPGTFS